MEVYIVAGNWQLDTFGIRVYAYKETARADCTNGRTYLSRTIIETRVCPECGQERK